MEVMMMLRSFISTILMTISALLALFMIIAVIILGYRNIVLLAKGILNPSLILEFVGATAIFGILIGLFKFVDDNNYDHRPKNNTIGEVPKENND